MARDAGPPKTGPGEREVLLGFLDYLRASVIAKVEGVAEPAVRTPGVASGTNLLGLVKHLTHVERHWVLGERTTKWAATFRANPGEGAEDIVAAYRETAARVNARVAEADVADLRWTLTHLIEETGRHAGHMDILRELIDGATGR
ncbi:DinB family protein [Amycolatopsis sp. cg9]|uniref:DinB family protein n=1 Tax=Amycolatopsis sp. cg9 TaxID=3238801 RepID=UPI003525B0D1